MSFVFAARTKSRWAALPIDSDWSARIKSFSVISVSCWISSYVMRWRVLNNIKTHIWREIEKWNEESLLEYFVFVVTIRVFRLHFPTMNRCYDRTCDSKYTYLIGRHYQHMFASEWRDITDRSITCARRLYTICVRFRRWDRGENCVYKCRTYFTNGDDEFRSLMLNIKFEFVMEFIAALTHLWLQC